MLLVAALCLFSPCLSDFSKGMDALIGQPEDVVIQRLGLPDKESTIAGRKVYSWGTDQQEGPSCAFKVSILDGKAERWDGVGNAYGCSIYTKGLSR
jgi:hypothetical protein